MNYDDRLKLLGLERLELRRLHTDLITCYKIINNLIAVQFDSLFKFAVDTIVIVLLCVCTGCIFFLVKCKWH